MKIRHILPLAAFAIAMIADVAIAQAAGAGSRTAEEWKAILEAPLSLFVLMVLASLTQGLTALGAAKRQGSTMTFAEYFTYWPEAAATIVLNIISFAVLILTDQLNFASALGIGFGVSNVVDVLMPAKNSRAAAVAATTPGSLDAAK